MALEADTNINYQKGFISSVRSFIPTQTLKTIILMTSLDILKGNKSAESSVSVFGDPMGEMKNVCRSRIDGQDVPDVD